MQGPPLLEMLCDGNVVNPLRRCVIPEPSLLFHRRLS